MCCCACCFCVVCFVVFFFSVCLRSFVVVKVFVCFVAVALLHAIAFARVLLLLCVVYFSSCLLLLVVIVIFVVCPA